MAGAGTRVLATVVVAAGGWLGGAPGARALDLGLLTGEALEDTYTRASVTSFKESGGQLSFRAMDMLTPHLAWLAEIGASRFTYDKVTLPDAPAATTGFHVFAGVRYYFEALAERVLPYVQMDGGYRDSRSAAAVDGGYTETEEKGTYDFGAFGLRLDVKPALFVDLEVQLFDAGISATETTTTTTFPGGVRTAQSTQTKRGELTLTSSGAFSNVQIGLGLKL